MILSPKKQYTEQNIELTAIIPFLNEGDEVVNTVKSLRDICKKFINIIVIDDSSTDNINYKELLSPYDIKYILNKKRLGVAASRDKGVKYCETPYFILLDAHMRIYEKEWIKSVVHLLRLDDRRILCMQTKQLWKKSDNVIIELKDVAPVFGAYATFDKNNLSPNIEWNYIEDDKSADLQLIPCVLGAGYAASKRYWEYLRGLNGLKQYGCDEVYISMKAWMEGGKCVLLKKHIFGHIYRDHAPYKIARCAFIYNYLLVAYVIFDPCMWYWILSSCKLSKPIEFKNAWILFLRNKKKIVELKQYHHNISHLSSQKIVNINRLMGRQRLDAVYNKQDISDTISLNILKKTEENYGVVSGKMSAFLWLSVWDKDNNKNTFPIRQKLFKDIKDAILLQKIPFNFRYGLCGIGWGLFFLYFNGFIQDIDISILNAIDQQIQLFNLVDENKSLYYGTGGLIAYIVCREFYTIANGYKSEFSDSFISKIRSLERFLTKHSTEHICVYYSYLHLNFKECTDCGLFKPKLEDWANFSEAIPHKEIYWSYSFDRGVLGYSIAKIK